MRTPVMSFGTRDIRGVLRAPMYRDNSYATGPRTAIHEALADVAPVTVAVTDAGGVIGVPGVTGVVSGGIPGTT